jgi:hypothetical protein
MQPLALRPQDQSEASPARVIDSADRTISDQSSIAEHDRKLAIVAPKKSEQRKDSHEHQIEEEQGDSPVFVSSHIPLH